MKRDAVSVGKVPAPRSTNRPFAMKDGARRRGGGRHFVDAQKETLPTLSGLLKRHGTGQTFPCGPQVTRSEGRGKNAEDIASPKKRGVIGGGKGGGKAIRGREERKRCRKHNPKRGRKKEF